MKEIKLKKLSRPNKKNLNMPSTENGNRNYYMLFFCFFFLSCNYNNNPSIKFLAVGATSDSRSDTTNCND